MLCRRSASLIMSTRRSRAIATSIFRKFSACRSSREENASLPIFVTPSTRSAISRPNSRSRSALVAAVSSRTSCSSPAVTVVTSILKTTSKLRSEEHTSELQSQSNLVCRLLLEKKKKKLTSSLASHTPRHHTHIIITGRLLVKLHLTKCSRSSAHSCIKHYPAHSNRHFYIACVY